MSSSSSQLLRALNSQINHNPPAYTLPTILEPSPHPPAKTQSGLTSILLEPKTPEANFQSQMRYQQGIQVPECLTEQLMGLMASNQKLFQNVQSLLRQREKNAYDTYIGPDKQFLQVVLEQAQRQQNPYLDVVAVLIAKRKQKVQNDLEQGNLYLHFERQLANKKQVQKLQKLDLARMIQIKDGELRSKMDVLHRKLQDFQLLRAPQAEQTQQEQTIQRRLMENMDAQTYSLHSERTKIAREYVMHLNQQRRSFQMRRKERQALQRQQQKQRQAYLKQAQQMKQISKKQQILERIDVHRKKRQEQEKLSIVNEEMANKLLAQHHRRMPIFKLKQKQFEEKVVKPAQRYRQQKLNEIRNNRRGMSLQQIKKHEQKYLGKLQISQSKRLQQFKLIMKSRKSQKNGYYKGRAHSRMQQMTKEQVLRNLSLRQASKLKLDRMRQYYKVVHKLHPPSLDQQKRKELAKSIEDDLMRKRHVKKAFRQVQDQKTQQIRFQQYYQELPQRDFKKQGDRFFQEAKKLGKKKEKQTAAQQIQQLQKANDDKFEGKEAQKVLSGGSDDRKHRNLWQIRGKQLQQFANLKVSDALNFQFVKQNIQNLDSKAAQKEQLMKQIEKPMQQQLRQKGMLQEFYLHSIKQKIRLLE